VSSAALAGTARTSTSPLRIGGTVVWPEWFSGLIDEVRVYNRALSAAEIASDRDTAVGGAMATAAKAKQTARAKAKPKKGKTKKGKAKKGKAGKPRKTKRKRHGGTRWLKAAPFRNGY
jgi:hypothetical protein